MPVIYFPILAVQIDLSVVATLYDCNSKGYWHIKLKHCQSIYYLKDSIMNLKNVLLCADLVTYLKRSKDPSDKK